MQGMFGDDRASVLYKRLSLGVTPIKDISTGYLQRRIERLPSAHIERGGDAHCPFAIVHQRIYGHAYCVSRTSGIVYLLPQSPLCELERRPIGGSLLSRRSGIGACPSSSL